MTTLQIAGTTEGQRPYIYHFKQSGTNVPWYKMPASAMPKAVVTPYLPMSPDKANKIEETRAQQQEDAKVKRFAQYQELLAQAKKAGITPVMLEHYYKNGMDLSKLHIKNNTLTYENDTIKSTYTYKNGRIIESSWNNKEKGESYKLTYSYKETTLRHLKANSELKPKYTFKIIVTATRIDAEGKSIVVYGQDNEWLNNEKADEPIVISHNEYYPDGTKYYEDVNFQ